MNAYKLEEIAGHFGKWNTWAKIDIPFPECPPPHWFLIIKIVDFYHV
jgi:hypothetical protein